MKDERSALPADYETTGSVWIGSRKASGSFVKLRARADELSITTPIVSISFGPREVVALRPLRGLFGYGGFKIIHTVDGRDVQFWCRDAEAARQHIAATGFVPCGTPGGGPDPARRAQHEEDSHRSTVGAFKMFGILAAVLILIFGAIALGVTFGPDDGGVYRTTWATVQADPRVLAVTGTPVTSTTTSSAVNVVGSNGTAMIRYDVIGPKGRGTVDAAGTKTEGQWKVERFVFEQDGSGTRIDFAKGR